MTIDLMPLAIAFTIWAAAHSLFASLTAKAGAERLLGAYFRYYRIGYVLFSVATLAMVWFLVPRPAGYAYVVSGAWYYIFQGLRLLGLVGLLASSTQFDARGFLGLGGRNEADEKGLNTGGLFAFVRHPLYVSGLLVVWFEPRMTVWWLEVCVLATIYLSVGAWLEERKLVADYGDEYRRYQKRVPMWLPRLRKSSSR